MKRNSNVYIVFALLLFGIFSVSGAKAAYGEVRHTTLKGETLSEIAKKVGEDWHTIARRNHIVDPKKLRAGQVLILTGKTGKNAVAVIAPIKVVKRDNLYWRPGKDAAKNVPGSELRNLRHMFPTATDSVITCLSTRLGVGERGRFEIGKDGSLSAMVSGQRMPLNNGKMGGGHAVIDYTGNLILHKGSVLKKKGFSYITQDGASLMRIDECANPLLVPRTVVEEKIHTMIDSLETRKGIIAVVDEVKTKSRNGAPVEVNVSGGLYGWRNGLANGSGSWIEGMGYIPVGKGFTIGVGPYFSNGVGETGEGYGWNEYSRGIQVPGVKWNDPEYLYGTGLIRRRGIRQIEFKPRFLWDGVSGGNGSYSMTQRDYKAGFYTEFLQQYGQDEYRGMTLELYESLLESINSTWSGDSPQDRGSIRGSIYERIGLSKHFAAQLTLSGSYQNWDKQTFLQFFPSIRVRPFGERVVVYGGPWWSFPLKHSQAGITHGKTIGFDAFSLLDIFYTSRRVNAVHEEGTLGKLMSAKEAEGTAENQPVVTLLSAQEAEGTVVHSFGEEQLLRKDAVPVQTVQTLDVGQDSRNSLPAAVDVE